VHEVRTFDRHLPACGKVDQSEAIFICTVMQAVLAYHWLMYCFPANFCVHVSHHKDVLTIARKSLWGINLFHLVFWITAFAILYFLSSLIVIRRALGLYSDRTFQVANRNSFLRLLLVFIVLICPIFSYFS
jgi:hypothetical protein